MKQKRLQYKIAVWLTMGLMVMDPLVVPLVYAENPIEVDRNAPQHRQAQVGQAANGITLVNITGPRQVVYLAMIIQILMCHKMV